MPDAVRGNSSGQLRLLSEKRIVFCLNERALIKNLTPLCGGYFVIVCTLPTLPSVSRTLIP